MEHFAGLDVSVKETSVCIVDDTGKIVREVKVASEPDALLPVLTNPTYHFKRIGLEAGPLSQWLFSALAEVGLPVICVETRHMRAVLKAQINKTDRNDARGMAQMNLSAFGHTRRTSIRCPTAKKSNQTEKMAPAWPCLMQRAISRGKSFAQIFQSLRPTIDSKVPRKRTRPYLKARSHILARIQSMTTASRSL